MSGQPRISRRTLLTGLGGGVAAAAGYAIWGVPRFSPTDMGDLISDRLAPELRLSDPGVLDRGEAFDVCIIGSGPAGVTLGNDLAQRGIRTLIVESGPNYLDGSQDPRFAELDRYRSSGSLEYPVQASRLRAVGGASLLWTGNCARLKPVDFETWPISQDELMPYYESAERTLRVRLLGATALSRFHAPRREPLPIAFTRRDLGPLQEFMLRVGVTVDGTPVSQKDALLREPIRVARDLLPGFTAPEHAPAKASVSDTQVRALAGRPAVGAARHPHPDHLGCRRRGGPIASAPDTMPS